MDLRKKYGDRTDGEDTVYVNLDEIAEQSTDKYDTQELSAAEIQRRAAQEHQQQMQMQQAAYAAQHSQHGYYPQQHPYPAQPQGYPQQPVQNGYYQQPGSMPQNGGYYPQQQPMQPQTYPQQPVQNGYYQQPGGMPQNGYYPQQQPVQPQAYPQQPQPGGYYPQQPVQQRPYPAQPQGYPQQQPYRPTNPNAGRVQAPGAMPTQSYQPQPQPRPAQQPYAQPQQRPVQQSVRPQQPKQPPVAPVAGAGAAAAAPKPPVTQTPPPVQRPQPQPQPAPSGTSGSSSSGTTTAQRKRRSNKRPLWQTILRIVLMVIVGVFLLYSLIAVIGIFQTNILSTGARNHTAEAMDASYVSNVLVIGTDSRDITTDRGRSDSMILLSINSDTDTIYMTSFLRDVYVYIDAEHGYGKLNAAYSYGGAELLMDTIESNYRVKIDDYVIVSFAACCKMIDAVGGVEITLSDEEAQALDEILISEVNELVGDGRMDDLVGSGGTYTLSGKQALSYSRIRYVGNADFERTSRQRTVMTQVLKKASYNPIAFSRILMSALPQVSTNLSGIELYGYALKAPVLLMSDDTMQQQIPTDNSFYGDVRGGEDVLLVDFDANYRYLKETVYAKK